MTLKSLNRRIAATKAKAQAQPKAKKPIPKVDPVAQRVVDGLSATIRDVMGSGFGRLEKLLQRLLDRNTMLYLDESKIGDAVAKEISKMPKPEVKIEARDPVSYRATIERRGNQMVGALIEPVKGK